MEDCIFCKIAGGKLGSLVYEDSELAAFRDINPEAPVHILIVPKRHIEDLNDPALEGRLVGSMAALAVRLAASERVAGSGYRIVMNCGADAGQSVRHIHMHLLGGRKLGWPPG